MDSSEQLIWWIQEQFTLPIMIGNANWNVEIIATIGLLLYMLVGQWFVYLIGGYLATVGVATTVLVVSFLVDVLFFALVGVIIWFTVEIILNIVAIAQGKEADNNTVSKIVAWLIKAGTTIWNLFGGSSSSSSSTTTTT